ncbi:hypothetical protein EVAR_36760_1 [Eumeta japonica]|uniref:Uncharacterized protein n=1 Tax=Eumeta variegata TaxID=151549 RepID=A0A4C1X299_EUMVA|nr:hypothetical protein EVAR_36760_1 [Eumeta japonica]
MSFSPNLIHLFTFGISSIFPDKAIHYYRKGKHFYAYRGRRDVRTRHRGGTARGREIKADAMTPLERESGLTHAGVHCRVGCRGRADPSITAVTSLRVHNVNMPSCSC